jgi:hypothetical protein
VRFLIRDILYSPALIVVTAESAHCEILWTEDLNHGQVIRGVRIANPLKKNDKGFQRPPNETPAADHSKPVFMIAVSRKKHHGCRRGIVVL